VKNIIFIIYKIQIAFQLFFVNFTYKFWNKS